MGEERPSAADLGVSDELYERVLRDLERRGLVEEGPVATAADLPASPSRGLSARTLAVVVPLLVALVVVALGTGGGAGGADGDGSYAFLDVQTADPTQPVAYSSCRPIGVAVYPAGGPSDAEELVREAVGIVRSATGLDLSVIGSFGGAAPNWNFQGGSVMRSDPVSVSWQDSRAIARMTDDTAGLGGSPVFTNPDGSRVLAAGTIALSRDYYAELEAEGRHDQAIAVLLHEFGHVVGLDHVDDPGELMHDHNLGRDSFGPGDLEGLRLLGQGRCF